MGGKGGGVLRFAEVLAQVMRVSHFIMVSEYSTVNTNYVSTRHVSAASG